MEESEFSSLNIVRRLNLSSRQYSDSFRVGILLALTGGFLDAYTYISRGNVFANAQTGNMVMLGINFMEGNFRGIINLSLIHI